MQNAKDTFYTTLRSRLATLNSERTVVVRGATRPAVLVVENELEATTEPHDTFLLHWTDEAADRTEPMPLDRATCQVRYTTRGTAELAGLDRGRVLAAMDVELRNILLPSLAQKQNFEGDTAVTMATNIFWSSPEFGGAELKDGTITRAATVTVFALREVGE